jgi:DNA-binding transcriptional LysR family regulator
MPISLLYPHRRNVARRVRVFMEWLSQVLQEYVT